MESSSEEEAEFDIVCNVTEVKPYMFEPLAKKHGEESDSDGSSDDASDDEDLHRIGNVDWCECGQCVPMTTGRESLCCLEVPNTDPNINMEEHTCITEEEKFTTVRTNEAVIKTAMVVFLHDHGPIPDIPESKAFRYTPYRQWTAWLHGKLGGKYCRPIPSCAVKEIRKAFPSESGEYKGFEYAHHDHDDM